MRSFTLDTNCMIDVDESRQAAEHVRTLLAAHKLGRATVAMVASSASEKQRDPDNPGTRRFLSSLSIFDERRNALGFGGLSLLPPIGRFDISFMDHCLPCDEAMLEREHLIYRTLFPSSEPEWSDFAATRGIDPDDWESKGYLRWRNQMLDAQAFWAHENAGHEVFVTSDRNFRVLSRHYDFPSAVVCSPEEAAALLRYPDEVP